MAYNMKHTRSELTAIRKLRSKKVHPRDAEKKKSELFCKSYFGILQEERNLNKK